MDTLQAGVFAGWVSQATGSVVDATDFRHRTRAPVRRSRRDQDENPATRICVTDSAGDGVLGASMVVRGTDSEAGEALRRPPPLARAQN